jgi:hypothetical protein
MTEEPRAGDSTAGPPGAETPREPPPTHEAQTGADPADEHPSLRPEVATTASETAQGLVRNVPEFAPSDSDSASSNIISTLSGPPPKEPYNAQKKLDEVRARLAFRLVWVLIGVIAAGLAILFTLPWTGIGNIVDIRPTFELVFSGILTLVSTATGFYFGQQSTNSGSGSGTTASSGGGQ